MLMQQRAGTLPFNTNTCTTFALSAAEGAPASALPVPLVRLAVHPDYWRVLILQTPT
jgi:hypothetical protein